MLDLIPEIAEGVKGNVLQLHPAIPQLREDRIQDDRIEGRLFNVYLPAASPETILAHRNGSAP